MDVHIVLMAKVATSVGIGMLIGLEREWAHKEIGVRSFTIVSLLGTVSWLVSPVLSITLVSIILLLLAVANVHSLWKTQSPQITTSLALTMTNVLGMVIGTGNFFLAGVCVLVVTLLLSWKSELIALSGKLTRDEIRGILFLGFITAIIYPLLPEHVVDPWHTLNLRTIWFAVIIVSGLSFVNHVVLRSFGARGLHYSALLGGFVSSAATAMFLGKESKDDVNAVEVIPTDIISSELTMILRNCFVMIAFSLPQGLPIIIPALIVLCIMMGTAAGVIFFSDRYVSIRRHSVSIEIASQSPLQWRSIVSFSTFFLILTWASGLANHMLGAIGFWGVALIGAVVSTASSSLLISQQVVMGNASRISVTIITFLIALISLLENMVIFGWVSHRLDVCVRLLLLTLPIALAGSITLLLFLVL